MEQRLVHFGDFSMSYSKYGHEESKHTHDGIELVYIVSGNGEHIVNGNVLKAKKGTLCIMDYNCVHQIRMWENMEYYNILFKASFLDRRLKRETGLKELMQKYYHFDITDGFFCVDVNGETEQSRVEQLFFEMLCEGMEKKERYAELTRCCLDEVLNLMLRNWQRESDIFIDRNMAAAMSYIRENSDSMLQLNEVAARFNYVPKYFSQKLKDYCGMSFKQLLTAKRLADVINDLLETDLPMNEIILKHGFTNKTYFYNVFEKEYGVKPKIMREYKKNYMKFLELMISRNKK